MRSHYFVLLLIGWLSVVSVQTGSAAFRSPPTDARSLEISDERLQYFVTKVGDFLYRFGTYLDEFNYSLLEDVASNASVWHDQALARLKHEAVALCRRSGSYDPLGLAEELNRIGEEFDSRYSDRIRTELSQLSDDASLLVGEYVLRSDFRAPLRPWTMILRVVRENPNLPPENLTKFVCDVAIERL
jgi:hypothetical protein